ncbi:MAG: hypothetical protein ACP5VF_08430 [Acidobacteriota bacterium]
MERTEGVRVLWLRGALPLYSWVLAAIFASYVVLDLIAIPFARLVRG